MSDEEVKEPKESIAAAVQELKARRPPLRATGIFQHPPDWTKEELDFIADGLKRNLPIHMIASFVHCERHTLSKLIARMPELKRLQDDKYENLLDTAEYQADRLMQAGNASMVMFVLNTLGKKRGWVSDGTGGDGGQDESKVVIGVIPEEEVKESEKLIEHVKKVDEEESKKMTLPDPMEMAVIEDTVKEKVAEAVKEVTPKYIDIGDVSVGEPAYGSEGGGVYGGADPWADGANSPFFQ